MALSRNGADETEAADGLQVFYTNLDVDDYLCLVKRKDRKIPKKNTKIPA